MDPIFTTITIGMENAKKFLRENPTESKAVAARIFNVNARFLSASIKRGSSAKNEEHNKMLQNHEINALDDSIKRRSCSKSRKSTHQTGQRDDEKSSFYTC
jgi:hypothetical protein